MAASKRTVVGYCMSVYDQSVEKVNFRMTYHVKVKEMTFVGSSQDTASPGTIRSVNFPEGYVTDDDTYTYMIQSRNQDDYIRLTFDDWDLDPLSIIEFERANIERVHGTDDRPIVTSTRNWIRFKFSTGNKYGSLMIRSMGFKVTYSFTSNRVEDEPSTNCGGYKLDSSGGVLQFLGPDVTYRPVPYDCVWVIKRQPEFEKLYLKLLDSTVYRGSEWAVPNKFQLHDGLSSDAKFVRSFPPENTDVAKTGFKSEVGFYVRLTGSFFQDDKFRMAYASYDSLPAGVDQCTYGMFTCGNKRCIDRSLSCDGADHCGDNSDESSCPSSPDWGSQSGSPFSLSISIIIPIVVAMILVIVICLFVVFLRRCQQLQRRQPTRNSQVPSVSGRMARGRRTRRSQIRVTIQQEYEDAPPTYEEAIGTPSNLGYYNMAFMWSQPDIVTGLMSPPPYTDVIGATNEENGDSPSYPIENDPNRQLTARDSRSGRERRDTHGDTDRPTGGQRPPGQQPGDLHIVLRRNSNTPSSGTNSLEHNHSLGRQPLRAPVEAVYGSTLQQRNKPKDTASPQISVTNDGHKDTPHQSSMSVQTSVDVTEVGAAVEHVGEQSCRSTSAEAANSPRAPPVSQPHTTGRHRGTQGSQETWSTQKFRVSPTSGGV
ncbi:uncharacterized protein LOC135474875 [Liolophura sinensis]|uniref:uncharacterized protein LOC135474875 n=1 Tax=Liolophura sinensis TaxID=3198878 RepID=UPI003158B59C